MHVLPLAANHWRPQIPRALARKRRRRNGLPKKVIPASAGIFFDDDTFTANLPRAREIAKKTRAARPDLVVQQPGQH